MGTRKQGLLPLLAGVFLALFGFFMIAGSFYGPTVRVVMPHNGSAISSRGPLTLQFSRRMVRSSVENLFRLYEGANRQSIPGNFYWHASEVDFLPAYPFNPGKKYFLELAAGAVGLDGKIMQRPFSMEINIREPQLTYLHPASGAANLWRSSIDGADKLQLTHHDVGILTYDISSDGECIVYALPNDQNGVDLWLLDEKGKNQTLVSCGTAVCDQPVWAPAGNIIAYSHINIDLQSSTTSSEIRLLDVVTHKEVNLFQGGNFHETRCAWSSNGFSLACYDHSHGHVSVFNLANGSEALIPTHVVSSGVWLPDTGELVVPDFGYLAGSKPQTVLFTVDFENQDLLSLIEDDLHAVDIGLPDLSPDSQWMVMGLGFDGATTARQLWIADRVFEEFIPLTQNPRFIHAAYSWHPSGRSVVYQRYDLSTGNAGPEVVVWQQGNCELPEMCGGEIVMAEDAFLPMWLP